MEDVLKQYHYENFNTVSEDTSTESLYQINEHRSLLEVLQENWILDQISAKI